MMASRWDRPPGARTRDVGGCNPHRPASAHSAGGDLAGALSSSSLPGAASGGAHLAAAGLRGAHLAAAGLAVGCGSPGSAADPGKGNQSGQQEEETA